MSKANDPAIQELLVRCLHHAVRRAAIQTLQVPGVLGLAYLSRVERLMRIAIALAGAGHGMPYVQIHGLPPAEESDSLPELLTVPLADLLAARASDHLAGALSGDPDSLRALDEEADRLLVTENIQLV